MRKIIAAAFILLTAALLTAGAFLPAITADVMDEASRERSSSAPMPSLELEVSDREPPVSNEVPESAGMLRKLSLASRMYTIPITSNETRMTRDEVIAAAELAMADYEAAGIFEWFDVTFCSADPLIGLDAETPDDYLTFWSVYFENEGDPYQTLQLYIDDETGTAFYVSYDRYGSFRMDTVWEQNYNLLNGFSSVYFRHVGLSEEADYAVSTGLGMEYLELDGGLSCMRFLLDGTLIELYAAGGRGFEVFFPAEEKVTG